MAVQVVLFAIPVAFQAIVLVPLSEVTFIAGVPLTVVMFIIDDHIANGFPAEVCRLKITASVNGWLSVIDGVLARIFGAVKSINPVEELYAFEPPPACDNTIDAI